MGKKHWNNHLRQEILHFSDSHLCEVTLHEVARPGLPKPNQAKPQQQQQKLHMFRNFLLGHFLQWDPREFWLLSVPGEAILHLLSQSVPNLPASPLGTVSVPPSASAHLYLGCSQKAPSWHFLAHCSGTTPRHHYPYHNCTRHKQLFKKYLVHSRQCFSTCRSLLKLRLITTSPPDTLLQVFFHCLLKLKPVKLISLDLQANGHFIFFYYLNLQFFDCSIIERTQLLQYVLV